MSDEDDRRFDSWLISKLEEISRKDGDFISEQDIDEIFTNAANTPRYEKLKNFKEWYNMEHEHDGVFRHTEPIGRAGNFKCDNAVDQYFIRNEVTGSDNSYPKPVYDSFVTVEKQDTILNFISLPAYKDPAFDFIYMTKRPDACIVPILYMVAGKTFYPSITTDIKQLELVIKDLLATQSLEAKFDGKDIHGCIVIRKKPLKIFIGPKSRFHVIPEDRLRESGNWVDTFHGGFYLPIKPDKLNSGDHEISTLATQPAFRAKALVSLMALY